MNPQIIVNGPDDIASAQFMSMAHSQFPVILREDWAPVKVPNEYPRLGRKVAAHRSSTTLRVVYEENSPDRRWAAMIYIWRKDATAWVAATDETIAREVLGIIRRTIPEDKAPEGQVKTTFWYECQNGISCLTRNIGVTRLSEIIGNYSESTQRALARLASFVPERSGAILFYGPPGTGKTYAIRALLETWKDWAESHVVSDPERFLLHTNYLFEAVADSSFEDDERWKVVVLEDVGDLVRVDSNYSEAIGRLLNMADGLLGQGLKVILILTTNDEDLTLHPALTRPGRCLAKVRFSELAPHEVQAWASKHGVYLPEGKSMTLAECYASGQQITSTSEKRVGFAVS
jgi:hypothetical protein